MSVTSAAFDDEEYATALKWARDLLDMEYSYPDIMKPEFVRVAKSLLRANGAVLTLRARGDE